MAAANATIDHREIQQWVEARGGQPALHRARGKGEIWSSRDEGKSWSVLARNLPEVYAIECAEL